MRFAESLANDPEFIKARFHIDRFIIITVDTEADHPPCDSPNLATAEFPNVSPPSPLSRGLGSASGFPPRQYS
jgi:hypothetical protein